MGSKSFFIKLIKPIKDFDFYGKRITFTYKGEEEYKTYTGGCTSLAILCVLAVYFYFLLDILINNKDTAKNTNSLVRDLFSDTTNTTIAPSNLSFSFVINNGTNDQGLIFLENRDYFNTEFKQYYKENGVLQSYSIPLGLCDSSTFRYGDQSQFPNFSITDTNSWPQNYNLFLLGNLHNSQYSYFEFTVRRCENGTDPDILWKTSEEIDAVVEDLEFRFSIVNSYFDYDEYDNDPIKYFVDDRFDYRLIPDQQKFVNVYVRENEVELKDNIFRLTPSGQEKSFLSVSRVIQDLRNRGTDEQVIAIRFEKDYDYDSYEREVFSLLDLFGNLGGLSEVCTIIGGLFVGIFADRLFNYSIISSLYQIDPSRHNFDKKNSNDENRENRSNNYSNVIPEEHKAGENVNERGYQKRNILAFSSNPEQHDRIETKEELQDMAKISMSNRRLYSYNLIDFGYNLLCCWKCWMPHKKRPYGLYNRYKLHEKGLDKFF